MKIFIFLSLLLLGACVANNISEYSSKKINGSLNQTEVYAFIGKKISVNHFTPEVEEGVISLSSGYKANYEILEQFSGEMLPTNIQFEAYTHFRYPQFAEHDIVLLYLIKVNGDFYHLKYTFDTVYESKKHNWVTCGTTYTWDKKRLMKPKFIWQRLGCIRGNKAINIARERTLSEGYKFND